MFLAIEVPEHHGVVCVRVGEQSLGLLQPTAIAAVPGGGMAMMSARPISSTPAASGKRTSAHARRPIRPMLVLKTGMSSPAVAHCVIDSSRWVWRYRPRILPLGSSSSTLWKSRSPSRPRGCPPRGSPCGQRSSSSPGSTACLGLSPFLSLLGGLRGPGEAERRQHEQGVGGWLFSISSTNASAAEMLALRSPGAIGYCRACAVTSWGCRLAEVSIGERKNDSSPHNSGRRRAKVSRCGLSNFAGSMVA